MTLHKANLFMPTESKNSHLRQIEAHTAKNTTLFQSYKVYVSNESIKGSAEGGRCGVKLNREELDCIAVTSQCRQKGCKYMW